MGLMFSLISPAGRQMGRADREWKFPGKDLKSAAVIDQDSSLLDMLLHLYLCSVPHDIFKTANKPSSIMLTVINFKYKHAQLFTLHVKV